MLRASKHQMGTLKAQFQLQKCTEQNFAIACLFIDNCAKTIQEAQCKKMVTGKGECVWINLTQI